MVKRRKKLAASERCVSVERRRQQRWQVSTFSFWHKPTTSVNTSTWICCCCWFSIRTVDIINCLFTDNRIAVVVVVVKIDTSCCLMNWTNSHLSFRWPTDRFVTFLFCFLIITIIKCLLKIKSYVCVRVCVAWRLFYQSAMRCDAMRSLWWLLDVNKTFLQTYFSSLLVVFVFYYSTFASLVTRHSSSFSSSSHFLFSSYIFIYLFYYYTY